ncbi:MAG TPA: hypothetical protein VF103_12950, partial [Polyangiaceae bacterium]
ACPTGSVCLNPKRLTGALKRCATDAETGATCVETADTGPSLAWSTGYCSPLCTSDRDCAVGDYAGTCSLRVAGSSLEIWTGTPAGGGVCALPCEGASECPFGFDCRVDGRCDESTSSGGRSCAPCTAAPGPDGGVVVPATWRCRGTWYGADDGCDCGCGAVDPDCAGPTVASCDECPVDGGACGDCSLVDPENNAVCVSGPTAWRCTPSLFGDGTCDCGCGALDSDCASADASLCEMCRDADDGGCNGLDLGCPGRIDPSDNASCVSVGDWTCSDFYFGDGVCDCGCGAVDTDCDSAEASSCENCPLSGCSLLEFACPGSIDPSDNAHCVQAPEGFLCAPALFGDGACDCGCGVLDSDCRDALPESCEECPGGLRGGCNLDAEELCPGSIDPLDATKCGEAPPEWTCAPAFYGGGDEVCDCGCGVVDPDCADASVRSCTICHDMLDGGCNADGLDCPGSIAPSDNATCTG